MRSPFIPSHSFLKQIVLTKEILDSISNGGPWIIVLLNIRPHQVPRSCFDTTVMSLFKNFITMTKFRFFPYFDLWLVLMSRFPNWPRCSQIFWEGIWLILRLKYDVQGWFMTLQRLLQTCLIFWPRYEFSLVSWGSNSPTINAENAFPNAPKPTWIYEKRKKMFKGHN